MPPVKPFVAPAPIHFKLANGLEAVALLEKHTAPLVAMTMVVKSGATSDPAGKAGLAALTADLLDEGASAYTALELAQAFETLGASVGAGASYDATTISMVVLGSHLDEAAPLFAKVILTPHFAGAGRDARARARTPWRSSSSVAPRRARWHGGPRPRRFALWRFRLWPAGERLLDHRREAGAKRSARVL